MNGDQKTSELQETPLARLKRDRYLPGPRIVNFYRIEGVLSTKTPLHLASGANGGNGEADRDGKESKNTLLVQLDATGKFPVIPGSSLRGSVRNWLESSLTPFNSADAYDVASLANGDNESQQGLTPLAIETRRRELKKEAKRQYPRMDESPDEERLANLVFVEPGMTRFYLENLDLVAGLFGHGRFHGRLDFEVSTAHTQDWKVVTPAVAIDRRTGAASDKKLFNVQAVRPGVDFPVRITVRNVRYWELGMLFSGLQGFNHSFFPLTIGGHSGTDFGRMKWSVSEVYQIGDDEAAKTPERLLEEWIGQDEAENDRLRIGKRGIRYKVKGVDKAVGNAAEFERFCRNRFTRRIGQLLGKEAG